MFLCVVLISYALFGYGGTSVSPFRNTSLPWKTRVNYLVERLTVSEMVDQLTYGGGGAKKPCPGIERFDIYPYNFDTECLHGVMNNPSTTFPQSVGLAATFSPELIKNVAEAISVEARAIFNNASSHGDYGNTKSISCLAPFINIMRHPLWGRVQEVYGEDPYLSGELAAAYVKGLQGNHSRYVRANAGCKVVDVHSGPENIPVSRMSFNAVVSQRDMRLSYLPNFKACVDAGSYNLMCSYNSINGVPACANKWLLTDLLREEYGFNGYVISDEGAIERIYTAHKYVNSSLEAAAAAVNAGCNLELTPPPSHSKPIYQLLSKAVAKGLVTTETIAKMVYPLFYTRMRLGEFDPPAMNPYSRIGLSVLQSLEHRDLAVEAASQSFVLLKNSQDTLPLIMAINTLSMIGPMANNLEVLYGNYHPTIMAQYAKTPYQGLRDIANYTILAPGCHDNLCLSYDRKAVENAAVKADVIIVCLGTGIEVEAEGRDRKDLDLPGKQLDLLKTAVQYGGGVPVIVLLFSAGPVDIQWAKDEPGVHAIVQCFFPGQATGTALARVLAAGRGGHVVSPAGRLPYTWPASLAQVPPMTNYSMAGRTYRYATGVPMYPFGYGLSYTAFTYQNLKVIPSAAKVGDNVTVTFSVENTGSHNADEVTQLYISWVNCKEEMPQRQLVGVRRIHVNAGDVVTVTMTIRPNQTSVWNDVEGFIPHIGAVDLSVGGQQPDQVTKTRSNVLRGTFTIS